MDWCSVDEDDWIWAYTFTDINRPGVEKIIRDISECGQHMCSDEYATGVVGNIIGSQCNWYCQSGEYERYEDIMFCLNNIVFIHDWDWDEMLYSLRDNVIQDECYCMTFMNDCSSNTFGNYCNSNTFGSDCSYNTFGSDCDYNTFSGNYITSVRLGNNDKYVRSSASYVRNISIGEGCGYLMIACADTSETSANYLRNIVIANGLSGTGTSTTTSLRITIPDRNLAYETRVGKNSSGDLKIYCEADLVN